MVSPPAKLVVNDNKCSQWSFMFTSHSIDRDVKRLSNFPEKDVAYIAFSVETDNTSNHYIEGYIKTICRHRVAFMRKLIGPAIFDKVACVQEALLAILLRPSAIEHGSLHETRFGSLRNNIAEFKQDVREYPVKQLMTTYPRLFVYPGLVHPYVEANNGGHALHEMSRESSKALDLKRKEEELNRKREMIKQYEASFQN